MRLHVYGETFLLFNVIAYRDTVRRKMKSKRVSPKPANAYGHRVYRLVCCSHGSRPTLHAYVQNVSRPGCHGLSRRGATASLELQPLPTRNTRSRRRSTMQLNKQCPARAPPDYDLFRLRAGLRTSPSGGQGRRRGSNDAEYSRSCWLPAVQNWRLLVVPVVWLCVCVSLPSFVQRALRGPPDRNHECSCLDSVFQVASCPQPPNGISK